MSIKVMTYVWEHSKHKGSELLTLLAIADFAHDDGTNAYPSIATLAQKTRMTERNTQFVIKKLEESEELIILRNAGPHGTHVFRINLTAAVTTEPQKCELCHKPASRTRELDRHHICPRSWGGDDSLDNLLDVCQACHRRLHTKLAALRQEVGSPSLILTAQVILRRFGEDFSFRSWAMQFKRGEKFSPEKFSGEEISGEKSGIEGVKPISPNPSLDPSDKPKDLNLPPSPPQGGKPAKRERKRKYEQDPLTPQEETILNHLNKATGRAFRAPGLIPYCLRRGHTVEECLLVIDWWAGVKVRMDPEQDRFFGTETPFRPSKFDQYHAFAEEWQRKGRPDPLGTTQNGKSLDIEQWKRERIEALKKEKEQAHGC